MIFTIAYNLHYCNQNTRIKTNQAFWFVTTALVQYRCQLSSAVRFAIYLERLGGGGVNLLQPPIVTLQLAIGIVFLIASQIRIKTGGIRIRKSTALILKGHKRQNRDFHTKTQK